LCSSPVGATLSLFINYTFTTCFDLIRSRVSYFLRNSAVIETDKVLPGDDLERSKRAIEVKGKDIPVAGRGGP
jgi:hypothetical protein